MWIPVVGIGLVLAGGWVLYQHFRPPQGDKIPVDMAYLNDYLRREALWKGHCHEDPMREGAGHDSSRT